MTSVEYAGTYTLPVCEFTAPSGKQFKGWSTESAGEVITDSTYNVDRDTEFFAIWEDIPVVKYNVTFNANGGIGEMTSVEYAGTYTLPVCEFTAPSGKQFKGWSTTSNGEVITDSTYNVDRDTEFFAIWEDIPHTHNYGSTWANNEEEHWNECACGDKANKAGHKDSNNDGKCDTCSYEIQTQSGTLTEPKPEKNGLSGGAVVAIVVVSVIAASATGFAVVWFVIKKKTLADLAKIFKKN